MAICGKNGNRDEKERYIANILSLFTGKKSILKRIGGKSSKMLMPKTEDFVH